MPVYVDQLRDFGWRLGPSCHLIGDTLDELHRFAVALGLRRTWFQDCPPASAPHYDLTAKRRARAVKLGAVELGRVEFVEKVRELRRAGWPETVLTLTREGAERVVELLEEAPEPTPAMRELFKK